MYSYVFGNEGGVLKAVCGMLSALLVAMIGVFCFVCLSVPSTDAPSADDTVFEEIRDAEPSIETYRITLGFAGDVCFADNYIPMQHLAALGSTDLADGIDQRFIDLMRSQDVMWINNEFVYSDRGSALAGKAWTFRGATENVKYLEDLGCDVAGLANNHVFDYGEQSFLDTMDTLTQANIPYVGAGRNEAEAYDPVIVEVEGLKVAYVAASCAEYTIYTLEATADSPGIAWCYDDGKFLDEIRRARTQADVVIALPHWGTEHSTVLTDKQVSSAAAYLDAGADVVIGCHAHNLQGISYHDGKPILYNLGNFWFDDYDIDTMVAQIVISGERLGGAEIEGSRKIEVILYPGRQKDVFTAWAEGDEKNRIFRELEEISEGIVIGENGRIEPV